MPSRKKKQSPGDKSGKKGGGGPRAEDTAASKAELPLRAGMPAEDSVIAEKMLKSPKGRVYRILITDQMDAYDKPEQAGTKRRRKR